MTLQDLHNKVRDGNAIIGIIGLGRVGLPLCCVFATKGLKCYGIDIDIKKLESIKNSICPFHDPLLQKTLEKANQIGKLNVLDDIKKIKDSLDVIILSVGTPNTKGNDVDYTQLYGALQAVTSINIKDKMIILRSTMPPKSTNDIVLPFLENTTKLKAGEDFGLAVCPERILEGHAIEEISELPEIIGGINKISSDIAAELFLKINPKKDMLFTDPTSAELAKLFANIYRYISFALSNEFAIWAERYNVDASELIKLSNFNYPRCNIPKPGFVGGPCLSKDGTFLDSNTTFASIVSTAWKLNESIPKHIVNTIRNIVGVLFNKKIAVLGLAFKAGSDDSRDSPSVKLVEILKSFHADVQVHDPFVKNTKPLNEVLNSPEVVIIATNHKEFLENVNEIRASKCKLIYDVWSMFKKEDFPGMNYVRFGQDSSHVKITE